VSASTRREHIRVPLALTSFVGRQCEISDVKQALSDSRLVTLVGPGGVGKTRLAVQMSEVVARAFSGGIYFVDLSPINEQASVAAAIAEALELQSRSRGWVPSALGNHIADRSMLIILDNCEHVTHASAVIVDALLRACSGLRVLATSRQPLAVDGEHLLEVQPLTLPSSVDATASTIAGVEAVRLFADRARAAAPAFQVTPENQESVVELCRKLDGLPLALELAAARLRVLTPRQILDRLTSQPWVLDTASTTRAPRQRSLEALMNWSYELCTAEEQRLWARLSVFPGTFAADAAEAICAGPELPRESVTSAIAGLVDKSILTAEPHGFEVRYRMLNLVQGYGREVLRDAEELEHLRQQHSRYYAGRMKDWTREWFGPRQVEIQTWQRVERDNLNAALENCLAEGADSSRGMLLGSAIASHTLYRGMIGEGRHRLAQVLTTFDHPTAERARLLWIDGWLAVHQGDLDGAAERFAASQTVSGSAQDTHEGTIAGVLLNAVQLIRGDLRAAKRLRSQYIAKPAATEEPTSAALTRVYGGLAFLLLNDLEQAAHLLEEGIEVSASFGELYHRAETLWLLAVVYWQAGDLHRATEIARECLMIHRRFGHAVGTAECFEVLAWVASTQAEPGRAARLMGAAETLWRETDASLFPYAQHFHQECEEAVRKSLGAAEFTAEVKQGSDALLASSVALAMGEEIPIHEDGSASGALEGLTKREGQVAVLIAEGLTNKEIAQLLVISQRTAEGHVDHILSKLGFSSRAQVAAWVAHTGGIHPSRSRP
jgi:predicted ATPase/DNA-binding NarL/FixJ family response regulator